MRANERNRGPMNDLDYYVIQKNMEYLCVQLRTSDVIISNMFSEHILNSEDKEKIEKKMKKTKRKGIETTLTCLMESGGVNAFDPFIKCLYESGFDHVAEKLKLDRKERIDTMNIGKVLPDPNTEIPSTHRLQGKAETTEIKLLK
ncbi:hypothetical protein SNE40_002161 [Patella caerulea]|uniref:CARD domain-containing protein n=1 Tax=Patella caerulea TaxID=87958 RepID=A0AAN8PYS1_PATCE